MGAIVALAFAGMVMSTFASKPLPLTPLPAFTDPVAHPPAGMTLFAIRSGTMQSRAAFAYRGGSFSDERTFAMGGILVRHPKGDLLIDSGFGRHIDDHVRASPFLMRAFTTYGKGTPIVDQLTAAGIDPHHLMGVLLTHAHWDHVSGLDDFRDLPVFVSQTELDFIHSGDLAVSLIHSFGELKYQVYGFPSGPYLGFEQSDDFFGDGSVVVVAAGGHTPGSVIVFVTLPEGRRYAFIGDEVWQKEGVELPAERPWLTRRMADKDDARVRTVVVRLHMLKERFPDLVIVPAHDERVWATLPALPNH